MSSLGLSVPVAFGILAAAFLYIAFNYREKEFFGRFEIFFFFGNLTLLTMLFSIYSELQNESMSFANVVFPLFAAFMWIYVIANFVMFFRFLRNLASALMQKRAGRYLGV